MSTYKLRGSAYIFIGVLTFIIVASTIAGFQRHSQSFLRHKSYASRRDILDEINNATLGFQKILVINLPSRSDHRDALSLGASLTGLELDFIDGVTDVENKTLPLGDPAIRAAELGNWRAHLNAAR